jgi:hypothetical protein
MPRRTASAARRGTFRIRVMALLHRTNLHPTKLELLAAWLPGRPWHRGSSDGDIARVAAYRFDDPAGSVGIETMLVRTGAGPIHQVPLTYRDAPLDGGDEWLVGTAEHGVLGRRWVYDACGDPVYAAVLASVVLAMAVQAEEFLDVDGRLERRDPSMTVTAGAQDGDGPFRPVEDDNLTLVTTDTGDLAVIRRLDATVLAGTVLTGTVLTGTGSGQPTPVSLVCAAPR